MSSNLFVPKSLLNVVVRKRFRFRPVEIFTRICLIRTFVAQRQIWPQGLVVSFYSVQFVSLGHCGCPAS